MTPALQALGLGLLLLLPLSARAREPLRVGILDGSPPCSTQLSPGAWEGRAVDLWQLVAHRTQLPYTAHGYATAEALLTATASGEVDVAVGCLTVSAKRLERIQFSLPFQESGLALLISTNPLATGQALLRALLNPQLLRVLGVYLLVVALISAVVWRDEHMQPGLGAREQLRRYALVFQVLATGPGTNVIVSHTRGHLLVLVSWVVRLTGASLILSTITLDVLKQLPRASFQPRSLADLAGHRIAARPGSVSAQLLEEPPMQGRVTPVPLPQLRDGPALLARGGADAVLADDHQLRYVLQQLPAQQRSRLQLTLQGIHRESQAFAFSPALPRAEVLRINQAISRAKWEGLVP